MQKKSVAAAVAVQAAAVNAGQQEKNLNQEKIYKNPLFCRAY